MKTSTSSLSSSWANYARSGVLLAGLAFFWFLMWQIVFPYTSGKTDIDFLLSKQAYVHLNHYMGSFYLHIFSSLFVLAAGFTQFSKTVLSKYAGVHRWVGRGYVVCILFISGPGALVMSVYANGGLLTQVSFFILSVLWWFFTFQAYRAIRKGDVKLHTSMMWRSYALTLSAITLRLMQFFLIRFTSLDAETSYQWVAYPSWLVNWAVAEIIIWRMVGNEKT
jgi:uncharacterized membrane protein